MLEVTCRGALVSFDLSLGTDGDLRCECTLSYSKGLVTLQGLPQPRMKSSAQFPDLNHGEKASLA